eukprot:scaffold1437_cov268-Pinguiococcus_pyrenoidosus.AAC.13
MRPFVALALLLGLGQAAAWRLPAKTFQPAQRLRLPSSPPPRRLPVQALKAVPGLFTQGLAVNTLLASAGGFVDLLRTSERCLTPQSFAGIAVGQKVLTPTGVVRLRALPDHGLHGDENQKGANLGRQRSRDRTSAVARLLQEKKESLGIAEGRGGARGPENVWGSAATAALCALSLRIPPLANAIGVPVLKLA